VSICFWFVMCDLQYLEFRLRYPFQLLVVNKLVIFVAPNGNLVKGTMCRIQKPLFLVTQVAIK